MSKDSTNKIKSNGQLPLLFIQQFKGRILFDVPMTEHTTLKIGGSADVVAYPTDSGDLKDLIGFANKKKYAITVLGLGANVLVRDKGVRGVVLMLSEGFNDIEWLNEHRVKVGSGVSLAKLLKETTGKSLSGLEFTASMPGTVGGALVMNAGAFGQEMKMIVESVEVVDEKGKTGFIASDDIGFKYRETNLPIGSIVTAVTFKFIDGDKKVIEDKIKEIRGKRKSGSPLKLPNAGSIFKNPEGLSAGKLIDELGLKGEKVGGAEISTVHGNYIVNKDNATAKDVLTLMALIRDRVFREKGVTLEPEIKVIGED